MAVWSIRISHERHGLAPRVAGIVGMKNSNYNLSMGLSQNLFQAIKEMAPDQVATDCPGCKLQIEQGTGLIVTHTTLLFSRAQTSFTTHLTDQ